FYRERECDAVRYFQSAVQCKPDNLRARYLICLAAHMQGDDTLLEQTCTQARQINRHDPYALACEAIRFLDYANYPLADQYFEQALLAVPNDVGFWFGRGLLYEYSGEREKAIGAYLRVIALDPRNVSGRLALGDAYADVGDFDRAMAEYVRAKELAPDTLNPHLRLGKVLMYAGAARPAIAAFREAIAEEPEKADAYVFLLACLRNLGDADEVLDVYAEIRRRFDDQPANSASLFQRIGAYSEAIREYRRAKELAPGDVSLRVALASCLRELGEWEAAAAEYQDLLELDPRDQVARRELAVALFRMGQYEAAAVEARRAIELDSTDTSAYGVLSDALVMQGKTRAAAAALATMERIQRKAQDEFQRKFFGHRPEPG
ncbi:MAG: tetratricopeptide repeat protein, partial [candidate division WOR-3 bacterium]